MKIRFLSLVLGALTLGAFLVGCGGPDADDQASDTATAESAARRKSMPPSGSTPTASVPGKPTGPPTSPPPQMAAGEGMGSIKPRTTKPRNLTKDNEMPP